MYIILEWINKIGIFVLIGFFAQLIDGALGMAYGVLSSSFLLSFGVSPAVASASIHIAEIFTTAVSGFSHLKVGNIDKTLFKNLLLPGMVGGVLGAITISLFDSKTLKPFIAIFLLLMGIRIVYKALSFNELQPKSSTQDGNPQKIFLIPLALCGGFFDASGGGGWGPIVTSTLLAKGNHPRKTIGSVNSAEFFVTIVQVAVFITFLKLSNWHVILGLIIGGVIAAPFGAQLVKRISARTIMFIVGFLICFLQLRTIIAAWV